MKVLLLTIVMLMIVAPAMAGNYIEDFESYDLGQLNFNSNWIPTYPTSDSWSVVDGLVMNGTQAIKTVDPVDLPCPYYTTGTTFVDGTVASIDVRMQTGGWFSWNVCNDINTIGVYPTTPFVGLYWTGDYLCCADAGYGWCYLAGATMYAGDRYTLSATLNFTNQTVVYGVTDLSNSARSFSINQGFGYATTAASATGGNFYLSGADVLFDNMAVTTVPEPSAFLAIATGLMGIGGFSIRRKK